MNKVKLNIGVFCVMLGTILFFCALAQFLTNEKAKEIRISKTTYQIHNMVLDAKKMQEINRLYEATESQNNDAVVKSIQKIQSLDKEKERLNKELLEKK